MMRNFPAASLAALVILAGATAGYSQTPAIAAGGILNGASFDTTGKPVAPGSIVAIFGTNLASGNASGSSVPLSVSLANVSVTFNGAKAPIYFVSAGQINVQVPWEVLPLTPPTSSGTAQVVVTNTAGTSAAQTVALAPAAPGIFQLPRADGTLQAIAYGNVDGIIAAPAGSIAGLTTHPAKINDPNTLVILATGLGPVDSTVANGDVPTVVTSNTLTKPVVTVGQMPAQVVFSGLVGRDSSGKALGFVGVYQINIIIAPGTPTGDSVPVQISMNGITSPNTFMIAVSQ
ncbi:MAG TPA: IPT/TIG domain-containing protein [Bryobacteraceae bacterium]|jgi:uncharacterized protein (TIGR03437 family)